MELKFHIISFRFTSKRKLESNKNKIKKIKKIEKIEKM